MGSDEQEEIRKTKRERDLNRANMAIDKAREAAGAHDEKECKKQIRIVLDYKYDFMGVLPEVLGHAFIDWYRDLRDLDFFLEAAARDAHAGRWDLVENALALAQEKKHEMEGWIL